MREYVVSGITQAIIEGRDNLIDVDKSTWLHDDEKKEIARRYNEHLLTTVLKNYNEASKSPLSIAWSDLRPAEEYPGIAVIESGDEPITCTCPIHDLMNNGCTCSGFKAEMDAKYGKSGHG